MTPLTEGHNASIAEFVPELDRLVADVLESIFFKFAKKHYLPD